MTESFAELFEQSAAANLAKLKPGSIVSGVVVDVRTDVFAFASVMYEALTGVRPFAAGTLAGQHPWQSEALDRTGAKVVAVERGGGRLGVPPVLLEDVDAAHLDLAVFDIDEAVGGFPGTRDERAGRIATDRADSQQRRDVRRRKGNALHLAQIAPDGFHTSLPFCR